MEFSVLDPQTDETFQKILLRIRRLQSGGTLDSLQTIGANTERQIGASYVSLKELASAYTPNEQLARLLWSQQRREEQIVACMLFPERLNKEKIMQLIPHCLNFEIAGYLGSLYLYKHPDLKELAQEWSETEIPFLQTALLAALARHLILNQKDSKISKEFFHQIVNRHYKDKYVQLTAERYRFNI